MKKLLKSFLNTDSGAITTEFLVIVAAAVGLGVAGVSNLSSPAPEQDVDVNVTLERFSSGN